ncbi:hypothetical protein EVAR_12587_1 [Eumeta japonica]|uniref:Uncharacterized protein n=1 Tax=Eumeta variegata TaxID=151549 RepID=A0A4C1UEP0_EUMVA|nr:hypothetical protein EVAR_12587_1 [Eumeta japonica]
MNSGVTPEWVAPGAGRPYRPPLATPLGRNKSLRYHKYIFECLSIRREDLFQRICIEDLKSAFFLTVVKVQDDECSRALPLNLELLISKPDHDGCTDRRVFKSNESHAKESTDCPSRKFKNHRLSQERALYKCGRLKPLNSNSLSDRSEVPQHVFRYLSLLRSCKSTASRESLATSRRQTVACAAPAFRSARDRAVKTSVPAHTPARIVAFIVKYAAGTEFGRWRNLARLHSFVVSECEKGKVHG